jgi:hypothetical protein
MRIKVTIEYGHGNHLAKAMGSSACWYAYQTVPARQIPPVSKRKPFLRDNLGNWLYNPESQITSRVVEPNEEMAAMKRRWQER